jgi:hypothetical protein
MVAYSGMHHRVRTDIGSQHGIVGLHGMRRKDGENWAWDDPTQPTIMACIISQNLRSPHDHQGHMSARHRSLNSHLPHEEYAMVQQDVALPSLF